jgi:hypothetical protein
MRTRQKGTHESIYVISVTGGVTRKETTQRRAKVGGTPAGKTLQAQKNGGSLCDPPRSEAVSLCQSFDFG